MALYHLGWKASVRLDKETTVDFMFHFAVATFRESNYDVNRAHKLDSPMVKIGYVS